MKLHYLPLILVLACTMLLALQPAYAAFDLSPALSTSKIPAYGRRLIVHDTNAAASLNYYAAAYVDASSNIRLAVYEFSQNNLLFTQQAVAASAWIGASYGTYALSDPRTSSFYLAFQKSATTIGIVKAVFNYTAYTPYNLIITTTPVIISSIGPIYNSGLDMLTKNDTSMWVGYIYQTSTLNAAIAQVVGSVVVSTTIIPLDFNQIWSVQLAIANSHVYAWVAGIGMQSEGGRLYDAQSGGSAIYTTPYYPQYSSAISLMNNSLAVVYQATNNIIGSIVYTPPSLPIERTIQYWYIMTDISAFALPNQYFGFYFTSAYGLSIMYYGPSGWTPATAVNPNTGSYRQAPISADRDGTVNWLGGHPACWAYTQIGFVGQYYNLASVDLPNLNQVSIITSMNIGQTTLYQTTTSYSTRYASTTSQSTLTTISVSGFSTSGYLVPMFMLIMFLAVFPALLGYFLGFMGYTIGVLAGAGIAYAFGQIPLWILLVTVLLITVVFVMFRGTELKAGSSTGSSTASEEPI